jgi:hypothetical protein
MVGASLSWQSKGGLRRRNVELLCPFQGKFQAYSGTAPKACGSNELADCCAGRDASPGAHIVENGAFCASPVARPLRRRSTYERPPPGRVSNEVRIRENTHAYDTKRTNEGSFAPLRRGCEQDGRKRPAAAEAGHAAKRARRKGRQGDEPQAGDCHRAFGSAREGREGSAPARPLTFAQHLSLAHDFTYHHSTKEIVRRRQEVPMLEAIAVVLVLLWLLGMVSSYTIGGFIHVLLILAIVTILIRLIRGRAVV